MNQAQERIVRGVAGVPRGLPPESPMLSTRRSDYDVTNTVRVSSVADVRDAVRELFYGAWPLASFDPVARAFFDFEELFAGRMPGYFGVDTVYHDQQHTLDVTLAMARCSRATNSGTTPTSSRWARSAAQWAWCSRCSTTWGICARSPRPRGRRGVHPQPRVAQRASSRTTSRRRPRPMVRNRREAAALHGYEIPFDQLEPQVDDRATASSVTCWARADMIAQMADRCYLEKCRDRLYPEFVLGGVALPLQANGGHNVRYASGLDLLRQTPEFIEETRTKRLDGYFGRAYRYLERCSGGTIPTSIRSSAASPTCGRSCAAKAGACCAASRRWWPRCPMPSATCAGSWSATSRR